MRFVFRDVPFFVEFSLREYRRCPVFFLFAMYASTEGFFLYFIFCMDYMLHNIVICIFLLQRDHCNSFDMCPHMCVSTWEAISMCLLPSVFVFLAILSAFCFLGMFLLSLSSPCASITCAQYVDECFFNATNCCFNLVCAENLVCLWGVTFENYV